MPRWLSEKMRLRETIAKEEQALDIVIDNIKSCKDGTARTRRLLIFLLKTKIGRN